MLMVVTVVSVGIVIMMVMIVIMMVVAAIGAVNMIMFMIVVVTIVIVIMPVVAARPAHIGAALGVEGGLDVGDLPSQALHHVLDDRVPAHPQASPQQFGGQVAVAEVPGETGQSARVGGADFGQRFRRGYDFDDAAVVELQAVAGAQRHGLRQIEQEVEPAHARHRYAPTVALVEFEHDAVAGLGFPAPGGENGKGAKHKQSLSFTSRTALQGSGPAEKRRAKKPTPVGL